MGDSLQTKNHILKTSAGLFNLQGYKATSISDITKETGLTKGAVYAHFGNKEALECAALLYMANEMMTSVGDLVRAEKTARQKLLVVVEYFSSYTVNPPFEGGCPLINAGVEADDAHPGLKQIVSEVMNALHTSMLKILKNGIKHEEIDAALDVSTFASLFVSSLEGAIVLMNVTGVKQHLRSVSEYLRLEVIRITEQN